MKIWNGIDSYPAGRPPAVATIGNYDGVHLGHAEILRRVVEGARATGGPALVISFTPHPLEVVAPERRPPMLHTRGQTVEAFEANGVSDALFLDFDARLAALDGREFFQQVIAERVPLSALFVGSGFRFGHRRAGDTALLRDIGAQVGFAVHEVEPVHVGSQRVSSSSIRNAVSNGDVELAASLLGRPYAIAGSVVRGEGRGRSLGRPTANLDSDNELLPTRGVYVTETVVLAARHASVTNVGVRPTFGGEHDSIETHLLGVEADLYDERIEVRFLARLRDEIRFESAADLADQLARDCAAAEAYFANQPLGVR